MLLRTIRLLLVDELLAIVEFELLLSLRKLLLSIDKDVGILVKSWVVVVDDDMVALLVIWLLLSGKPLVVARLIWVLSFWFDAGFAVEVDVFIGVIVVFAAILAEARNPDECLPVDEQIDVLELFRLSI